MIGKLLIDDVVKATEGKITTDWDVKTLARFRATLVTPENLAGFTEIEIHRDDLEIFGGRIHIPKVNFSARGMSMPISGFDYTAKLKDYLTPSQSIVDTATATALAAIISETPFSVEMEGTFETIKDLKTWDTSLEFLQFAFADTCIEFDPSSLEFEDEFEPVTINLPSTYDLRYSFYYPGATPRFYIFDPVAGGNIYYHHSTDGVNWTTVDSGANSDATVRIGVAYYNDQVYLMFYQGGDTDCWVGTVTDATGTIVWVQNANVLTWRIRGGPYFDDDGHIWVIHWDAVNQTRAYESTDDGATFNLRFTKTGGTELRCLAPIGSDGDMMSIVYDTGADDIEEWLWDRSAGTHTFVRKIDNSTHLDEITIAQHGDLTTCVMWNDTGFVNDGVFFARLSGGVWTTTTLEAAKPATMTRLTMSCDGYKSAYCFIMGSMGVRRWKLTDGVEISETDDATHGTNNPIDSPRTSYQDGRVGIFLAIEDNSADGWFQLFDPVCIWINMGSTTGSFTTDSTTGSGAWTNWGILTAEGVQITDCLWSVLKASDDSVLASNLLVAVDIKNEAGVTEASIKIKCDMTDTGTDPYITDFSLSERVDEVTLDTDYEDCLEGVEKLALLVEGEYWITKDNGTYTLHFSSLRGDDKTDVVTLKTARSSAMPEERPNITLIGMEYDWNEYANCIKVIGGTVDATRIEAEAKDNSEIDSFGQEVWKVVRDADLITDAMALSRGYVELFQRNSVPVRMFVKFIDWYDTGLIEIGDRVTVIAEFEDEDLSISGSQRVIQLKRILGIGGETVSATFSFAIRAVEYWKYMQKTSELERWITA